MRSRKDRLDWIAPFGIWYVIGLILAWEFAAAAASRQLAIALVASGFGAGLLGRAGWLHWRWQRTGTRAARAVLRKAVCQREVGAWLDRDGHVMLAIGSARYLWWRRWIVVRQPEDQMHAAERHGRAPVTPEVFEFCPPWLGVSRSLPALQMPAGGDVDRTPDGRSRRERLLRLVQRVCRPGLSQVPPDEVLALAAQIEAAEFLSPGRPGR